MVHTKPTIGDTAWFVHDRFGMFIHWGLYAQPARGEWVKGHEQLDAQAYEKYFESFDPDLFDAKEWARAARQAGMKYFVVTAKHHEGFCLWDTQFTDYKITNTAAERDLLQEIVEAFRQEGLKVGLYYSLIDWHHADFPIDVYHPMRNAENAAALNQSRDITKYAEYMKNQVRELLTDFGKIDILWFDFSYPHIEHKGLPGKGRRDWQSEELLKMARELQPGIIVDNRLDLLDEPADVYTPEQYQPSEWVKVDGEPVVWETCQTLASSWGYHRDESAWKTPEQLIQMLINTVSCGGNLLMNVGPTARGTFDDRTLAGLEVYGDWMRLHARSIRGCTQSEYPAPPDCRFTQKGNRLYVHVYAWPFQFLHLPGLAGKVAYAQLLNDASEIKMQANEWIVNQMKEAGQNLDVLTLELPIIRPNVVVPVVELFLKD